MKTTDIIITGGRENNLKNINLKIPKNKITIFTGVSGSGKSSIVFDTLAQEAGRQLNETYSTFARQFLPKYSRPNVDKIENLSPAILIQQKGIGGNARSTLGTATDINSLLRILFSKFAKPSLGYANAYGFNDPLGMCSTCQGIGRTYQVDPYRILDWHKSLNDGAIRLPNFKADSYFARLYTQSTFFDNDKLISDYSTAELAKLLYAPSQKMTFVYGGEKFSATYEGLVTRFERQYIQTVKEQSKRTENIIEHYTSMQKCPDCGGKRYNQKVLSSTINGYNMYDLTSIELDQMHAVIETLGVKNADAIINGIKERVQGLVDMGLGYMTLTRETPTLSGGESQRVKIVKHLSSSLTGMLYIFDEPSTGLHPRDIHLLNDMLIRIRDAGNTVLIVEHDPDVIKIADCIVDVGPLAGVHGGEIQFVGSFDALQKTDTLTAKYLTKRVAIKKQPRLSREYYSSQKSSLNNLKNVSLRVPKGVLTVVTGVAGSGKSSLVTGAFLSDFPNAIYISQKAVHTNSRSNPATYIGIMTAIRTVFAETNHVKASLFSFNSEGGCPSCQGKGKISLTLSYMDTTEIVCPDCQGTKFKSEVLKYVYKGYNIVDIMNLTVDEAYVFFDQKDILNKLKLVIETGLGYLSIGQSLDTLSGGEAQRLKIAKEMNLSGNIFILDEPTTGLHMKDVENLIAMLNRLVDKGNTVIVIEHNTDVMRSADWLVDIGPEGGKNGGRILFEGYPTNLRDCESSITARYI